MKKILALLMCVMLVVSAVAVTTFAAGGTANVSMVVDAPAEVKAGDTITVTLNYTDMVVSSFAAGVKFDSNNLTCISVVGARTNRENLKSIGWLLDIDETWVKATSMSSAEDANKNGYVGLVYAGTDDWEYIAGVLFTATFVVKEGATGTVNFSTYEDSSGTNGCKNENIATQTVPVAPAAPACEHTNTRAYDNGDGTHSFYCTNNDCNAPIGEAVSHDFNTAYHMCVCGVQGTDCSQTLEYVAKTAPTCNQSGNKEYWDCIHCDKAYADAAATSEIEDLNYWKREGDGLIEAGAECNLTAYYTWKNDYSGCLAEYKCEAGTAHRAAGAVVTHAITTVGTCQTAEVVTYYADFTTDWGAEDQALPVTGEKKNDVHVGNATTTYNVNNNGTHTVVSTYDCGHSVDGATVEHTYDANTHKCVCNEVEKFTIYFYETGDVPYAPITMPYGSPVAPLANPTKAGYNFVKWSTPIPNIMPGNDVHITAEWECNHGADRYKHTYIDNGKGTHTVKCECGETLNAAEAHNFTDLDYECECGAKYTGWNTLYVEDVPYTRYILNGNVLYGWNEVEGAWYYFSTTSGDRATGMTRVPYPTVAINGITYVADQDAVDYDSDFIDAEKAWFLFGTDGKFNQTTGLVGTDKYAVNGMLAWHPGLVEIGENYYYFTGDLDNGGNKMVIGDVYMVRNTTDRAMVTGGIYTFGADGKLVENEGIVNGRYYEKAQLMIGNGLTKVGEKFIYVRSNGQVVAGAGYWVPENTLGIVPGYYTFDENGYMQNPEFVADAKNGIVDGYYYVNGKIAYGAGLIEIEDGKYIYVRSNGEVVMGRNYWITDVNETGVIAKEYTFDTNGIMCNPEFAGEVKNGIVNGYYYENGKIVYGAGLVEYNGGYIYVRSNGMVAIGKYWITVNNGLMESDFYTFAGDGMMIVE